MALNKNGESGTKTQIFLSDNVNAQVEEHIFEYNKVNKLFSRSDQLNKRDLLAELVSEAMSGRKGVIHFPKHLEDNSEAKKLHAEAAALIERMHRL